jgi:hypothetical protein
MVTKTAAKKASNKKRERHIVPGDSPITVGGGGGIEDQRAASSICISLDNNWYTPKPGDPEQHWNSDDEIDMLWVVDDNGANQHPEADRTKKITIHCMSANGHDSPITVKCTPLGVKFKLADYKWDPTMGSYCSTVARTIGDVKVSGISKPIPHHTPCLIGLANKLKRTAMDKKRSRRR